MITISNFTRRFFLVILIQASLSSFAQMSPADVDATDIAFWLRADQGVNTTTGGNVSQWLDQSTNGNNASGGTSPFYNATDPNWNNYASVSFASTSLSIANDPTINQGDQFQKTNIIAFRTPASVINGLETIYEQGGATNGLIYYIDGDGVTMTLNMGIYSGDGTNYAFQSVAINAATLYIATFTFDSGGLTARLNNSSAGFTSLVGGTTPISPLPAHNGNIILGGNSGTNRGAGIGIISTNFSGDIAEIIQYNRVLSALEQTSIANYLSSKYDIAISEDFYDGDLALNGDYDDEVKLIGNDGVTTSATKSGDFLTITDTGFGTGEYLSWGSNGLEISYIPASGLTNTYQVERIWSLDLTGTNTIIDNISFPEYGALSYQLVLDDNQAFSSPIELNPDNQTGGVVNFNNVDLSSFAGIIYLTVSAEIATPGGINALSALWYSADMGADITEGVAATHSQTVGFWKDQSGNNHDALQSSNTASPVYDEVNTINGNPVLSFDGQNDYMAIEKLFYEDATTLDEITVYSVLKSNNTDQGIVLSYDRSSLYRLSVMDATSFRLGSNQGTTITDFTSGATSIGDGLVHMIGADMDGVTTGDQNLYYDGARNNTTNTGVGFLGNTSELPRYGFISGNSEATTFDGNSGSGDRYDGDIAEIIYYEKVLSTTEKSQLESYLAIKYGITLSNDTDGDAISFEATEGDYIASDGLTVVWDSDVNSAYHQGVAGIAQDTKTNLNQSSSKSEDAGSVLAMTDNLLAEGDYIMWGHDNGDLSPLTTGTGSKDARYNRVWKIQITGSTASVDQIGIDLSLITGNPELATQYTLLLDDADDFSTIVSEVDATAINDNVVQFDNVDLTGITYLALGVTFDLDKDGVGDVVDLDDDNDGIPDVDEGNGITDADFDGIPDSRDIDSDNDGIGDLYESGAEAAGVVLATLDADGNGVIDTGNEGADGFDDRLEVGDVNGGGRDYTISDSDSDGVFDFKDLDTDNNGISDLAESGRNTTIDTDDDGVFEGVDADEDGVPDEIDSQIGSFGSELTPLDQDGTGEPDFRDLDNDDDGVEDIDEVLLTDTAPDDGRLDDTIDSDGDGVLSVRDGDDNAADDAIGGESFGQIDLASLATGAGDTWYSYRTGNWSDPDSWTLDPSGSTRINPSGDIPNNFTENVVILNGDEIALDYDGVIISSITLDAGGILNVGTTLNHNFNSITGTGKLKIASDNFPAGDISVFTASTGGTVEYIDQSPAVDYELTVAKTLNNLIINSTANKITLKSDLTLNGSLTIASGTLEINDNISDSYVDNTIPLYLLINGDVTIDPSGSLTVGNVDASSEIATSGIFTFHQLELLGDLTNNGTISFTNLSATSIADGRYRDKYPTAADLDNQVGSADIPAAEFGALEVLFTNGFADQTITLNGPSDFYRIEVKKGSSQTYMASFNASATSNFRLLGRIAMNQSDNSTDSPNIDNNRALGLEAGILRLGDNIIVDQVAKDDSNGSEASTQGNSKNYIIDLDAQLWVASNATVIRSSDWGWHPLGKLKVSDDATLTFTGTGQRAILVDDQGVFEMTGGTVNITQFRNKTGSAGAPRGSFIMTGGTLNIGGSNVDNNHAVFSIPWQEQNFILTPADPASPPVINITLDGNGGKDNAVIQIGVKEGNYNVGESTINIVHTENQDFKISSTAPFYNLTYDHTGANELIISDILDANDEPPTSVSAILPDDNSSTIPSPATFAQPLVILNDLTITNGRLDANDQDVTIGNFLTIDTGGEYDPGINTTYFNGSSSLERITLNGTPFATSGGFNNVVISAPGTEKILRGDLATVVILGDFTIGTGVTLNDNGKVIQVNGNIFHSGIHETDYTSPGRIEITGGTATHELGGDGTGRFEILTLDDATHGFNMTADQQIDSVLNLVNGVLDINTQKLTINSTATSPIVDDNSADGATNNFGVTRMIQTAGNDSDGGLGINIGADGSYVYPLGIGGVYIPVTMDISLVSLNTGSVFINPVASELQTTDLAGGNILGVYWKVSHDGFGTIDLPTVNSYSFVYDASFISAGTPSVDFVAGKVLDENPFTRSYEGAAGVQVSTSTILFDGLPQDDNGAGSPGPGFTIENANYTAGELARFVGAPTVYYSRNNSSGLPSFLRQWDDVNSWVRSDQLADLNTDGMIDAKDWHRSDNPVSPDFPGVGDVAIVGFYPWEDPNTAQRGVPHHFNIQNEVEACAELIFTQMTDEFDNPVARDEVFFAMRPAILITGASGQLNADVVSGEGQFFIRFGGDPDFSVVDLGAFNSQDSSIFFYEAASNRIYNNAPAQMPNLILGTSAWGANDRDIAFSTDIEIKQNLEIIGDANLVLSDGVSGDLDIGQNIIMYETDPVAVPCCGGTSGASGGGAEIRFPNASNARNVTVKGDVILQNEGAIIHVNTPGSTPLTHTMSISGSIVQNTTTGGGLIFWTGALEDRIDLNMLGSDDESFQYVSGATPAFSRLTINKGVDTTSTFTFNSAFTLNGETSGTEKALTLLSGSLVLDDAAIDIDINGGGGDFTIPETSALVIKSGTVRATATGTGTGNGVRLDGKLAIYGGNMILDGGTTADNYIEYGSAGGSEIEITSGALIVGSQLRRNPFSDDGVINYTQSGGTALFGANNAPTDSRGVFEIVNTGVGSSSSFNLSGAATTFAVVHGQSSPDLGTFIIGDGVAATLTSDPFIDFGFNGTVLGTLYQNDLNESYDINSSIALPNVRIDNSNFNSPILRMTIQPLTITDSLDILNGGTLISNNFDLTINDVFTNDGTYTPGTNTTFFNGNTQIIGGTTSTTFNNLTVNSATSLTLSNPITVNGNLDISSGQFDDAGNRVTLLGNLSLSTTAISDGSGTGGLSFEGTSSQQITLPAGSATIDKMILNNPANVQLMEQLGAAVVLNINDTLALDNGLFELGDNRIFFDADAQITTASTFDASRMILVNGVKKSDGVEKAFLASTPLPSFVIPVGTPGKYTPVTLDVISSGDPGSILVKPINSIHPSAIGLDALNYYWIVTTNPSTVSGFSGSVSFQYEETDANNTGQNEGTWSNKAARLLSGIWSKPSDNLVNTTTNVMTFSASDLSASGSVTFDGEFTIGNDIPDELARYRSITNGIWSNGANWEIDIDGNGFNDGNGVPQPGSLVIVDVGDEVTMNAATDNDQNVFSVQIDGILDINDSDGHNFGEITGNGTLRVSNPTLPGGDYDSFFLTTGGSLDLSGATSYTISPDFASGVRGLIISGGGVKTLPALTVNIGVDGLNINDAATLDNTSNNNVILVDGNVSINNGTLNLGNTSASIQAQHFTITTGTFNTSGGILDLSGDLNLSGGVFNAGGQNHTIGGDFNYLSAATFNQSTSNITFDGAADQNITSDVATLDFYDLTANQSAGQLIVGANTSVQVNSKLGLLNGSVVNTMAAGASLRLVGTAGYEAGSDGYVDGALFKDLSNTASPFTFRIGKGSLYKPVIINPLDASYTGDITWEAEYYDANPTTYNSVENSIENLTSIETNADPDEQVVEVTFVEFWRLDDGAGNGDLETITLNTSNTGITQDIINDQLLQIVVWDELNSEWDHLGGVSSGVPTAASLVSTNTLSFTERIVTTGGELADVVTPVELIYFSGVVNEQNHVVLSWATASELNNKHFEVQRSLDGVSFETFTTVEGNGTTNSKIEYSAVDRSARPGLNYYRLKQVDYDGAFEYHKTIQVENNVFNISLAAVLYPNPATSHNLNVRITSGDDHTPIRLKLVDMTGREYFSQIVSGRLSGDEKITPPTTLKPGLYFLIVNQGTQTTREKVFIR